MRDVPPALRTALQDRYRFDRVLGQGGMATVYLAEDLKHRRMVAIKVLRPELAAVLGRARFLREITITANLRHPNILPLFDSDEAAGFLYYAMPYVEGESLRQRLDREKQIPVEEALQLTREVADALGYAHDAGIVHRDIKPENILLERGHALVADFGIAHAVDAAGPGRLTETGFALGTPAYMSPEQGLGGAEIDGRTDLYALGTVLYEMLAGEPPYGGASPQALLAKRLMEPIPRVSVLRQTVSPVIEAALVRVLAKSPADRFTTAAQFVAAIKPQPAVTPVTVGLRALAGRHPLRLVAGLLVVIALAVGVWIQRPVGPVKHARVAVIPFRNAGSPEDEFFTDGLTEEITSRLGTLSGMEVVSRLTTLRYKGTTKRAQEIGKELDVQFVLTGTVRADRSGTGLGQFRVTPELIRVSDEAQVWTAAYTAGMVPGEIFSVQSQIAERVARAAGSPIDAGERQALAFAATTDPVAYEAYLMGRFLLSKGDSGGLEEVIQSFQAAVARDPNYALAYVGLAEAYAGMPFRPSSPWPDSVVWDSAEVAARRAISLDSTLSPAHLALATVLSRGRHDKPGAERELRLAVALDPTAVAGYAGLVKIMAHDGNYEAALDAANHAVALDPISADLRMLRADVFMRMDRLDEAAKEYRAALLLEPQSYGPKVLLAEIAARQGDLSGMATQLEALGMHDVARTMAAFATGSGPKQAVIQAIGELHSLNPGLDAARQGWLLANIGEPEPALGALEKSISLKSAPGLSVLQFRSVRDALGNQPRFIALLASLGPSQ